MPKATALLLAFTPKRHLQVSYNAIPHLEYPDYLSSVTYSWALAN